MKLIYPEHFKSLYLVLSFNFRYTSEVVSTSEASSKQLTLLVRIKSF